jgi:hypothetical protein
MNGLLFLALVRARACYLFASYRPERHYMRGPGPRSREKERSADVSAR